MTSPQSAPPRACPDCHKAMKWGHVIGRPASGGLPIRPATIGWLPGDVAPSGTGISDQDRSDPLIKMGVFRWSHMPRFPAWICEDCSLVVFSFANPEEALNP
jgi:hypothetical protein